MTTTLSRFRVVVPEPQQRVVRGGPSSDLTLEVLAYQRLTIDQMGLMSLAGALLSSGRFPEFD